LAANVGCRTLPAPAIQIVDIFNIESISLRVISAPAIQICRLVVRQRPHEAWHLRSGSTFVDLESAEPFIDGTMDIESKNTGIRKLRLFFANHRRAALAGDYNCRASKNLEPVGVESTIAAEPRGTVFSRNKLSPPAKPISM
jgi:hypothetical protein